MIMGNNQCYNPVVLILGLGISGISMLETRNICSGRVPDSRKTRFVNSIQNARNRELQFVNDNVKSAEFCTTDDRYDLALGDGSKLNRTNGH